LDAAQRAGRLELLTDLTEPLLKAVMATVLGLPEADRADFDHWAHAASKINEYGTPHWSDAASAQVDLAFTNMTEILDRVTAQRRRAPRDDLISHFVGADGDQAAIGSDEILVNCWVLYLTGIRITGYLVAASAYFLLSRPTILDQVRDDPELVSGLVTEALRYAPSALEPTPRTALRDVDVNGQVIRRGDSVRIYFLDTNRDAKKFSDPQVFRPERSEARPLTFYVGPHFCVGAHIATVAAEEVCRAFADPVRELAIEEKPVFRRSENSPIMLGVEEFHLTVRPAPAR
jgi:cytochrome P450